MEDLLSVLRSVEALARELDEAKNVSTFLILFQGRETENTLPSSLSFQAHFAELDQLFFGKAPEAAAAAKPAEIAVPVTNNSSITPQQTKKRPKRLLTLPEDDNGKL